MYLKKNICAVISVYVILLATGCQSSSEQKKSSLPVNKEKYRPSYHFTPQKNWMNDPNGMVYYEGEYHLFYQYNPFGNTWGHMSWGHAVSKDLVQWEHLPLALAEENGVMIFSGSAVVDWNNSSGFGIGNKPPLVAIYTGHEEENRKQYQSIAFSNDKGRTWTKYEGNPVLDIGMRDFRDPKVFWYGPDKKWVMVVALSLERKLHLYSSTNLKDWTFLSEFGPENGVNGIWECPDLFEMTTSDGYKKWVLGINLGRHSVAGGSGGQYVVGHFDGTNFVKDEEPNVDRQAYVPPTDFIAITDNFNIDKDITVETNTLLKQQFFTHKSTENSFISEPFTLKSDYINFAMTTVASSEYNPAIELWVGDKRIRSTANNEINYFEWKSWNVENYKGQEALLKIDKSMLNPEVHLVVDALHLSNEPAFNLAERTKWMDFGTDFYAAVSWSDVPKEDGRRIWIGWMNNWHYATTIPSGNWRSSMSIARSLKLIKSGEGYSLIQEPLEELKKYRTPVYQAKQISLKDFREQADKLDIGDQFEVILEMEVKNAEQIEMYFGNPKTPAIHWVYNVKTQLVNTARLTNGNEYFHPKFSNQQQFKVELKNGTLKLRFFVDRNSLEIFHQEGSEVFTQLMYPVDDDFKWGIKSEQENNISLEEISIYKL